MKLCQINIDCSYDLLSEAFGSTGELPTGIDDGDVYTRIDMKFVIQWKESKI